MKDGQRPLIPVDPKGLDEIAAALLSSPDVSGDFTADVIGSLPPIVMKNPRGYIHVPERKIVIATRQAYNTSLDWEGAIKATQADKLRLTPVESFMQHYLNLREAALGKKQLVYADGSPVSKDESIQHWNYVSSTDRSPFGNKSFWTWLDAKFKQTPQGMIMETGNRFNGSKLESRAVKLDPHATANGWADLTLNAQGLPKSNSGSGYVQGQNIYFWAPQENKIAGFYAGSDGAVLYCGGGPAGRGAGLGVLACAAGVVPKNLGGIK